MNIRLAVWGRTVGIRLRRTSARGPLEPIEFLAEPVAGVRAAEQCNPFGRRPEHDALAGEAGTRPQRDRGVASSPSPVIGGGARSNWRAVQEVALPERARTPAS